jgi:DNA (cytosine-5)-methyltransferase 1
VRDYYNEHDHFAAAWLRELIAAGEIPAGHVDERDIQDVHPSDLVGYRHCHFFAGIGGWAYALRLADWPDDQPIWTGSCPCQPFSAAGQGAGFADERHLWPAFFWLISQCQPRYVCGEQVASGDALRWWDLVATDLEGAGYACTAVDLPAASVGAPHKRSRLFWLADAEHQQQHGGGGARRRRAEPANDSVVSMADAVSAGRAERWAITGRRQVAGCRGGTLDLADVERVLVADTSHDGRRGRGWPERDSAEGRQQDPCGHQPDGCGDGGGELDNAIGSRLEGFGWHGADGDESRRQRTDATRPVATASGADAWADLVWLPCTDGKARPTESRILEIPDELSDQLGYGRNARGTWTLSPLIQKTTNRVGRLRGYGNAVVTQAAAEVLKAWRAVQCHRLRESGR